MDASSLALRQIIEKRRNVEGKLERGDIVLDYTRYCSQTYAPLTPKGVFPKWNTQKDVVKNRYLDTYEGLSLNVFGLIKVTCIYT